MWHGKMASGMLMWSGESLPSERSSHPHCPGPDRCRVAPESSAQYSRTSSSDNSLPHPLCLPSAGLPWSCFLSLQTPCSATVWVLALPLPPSGARSLPMWWEENVGPVPYILCLHTMRTILGPSLLAAAMMVKCATTCKTSSPGSVPSGHRFIYFLLLQLQSGSPVKADSLITQVWFPDQQSSGHHLGAC